MPASIKFDIAVIVSIVFYFLLIMAVIPPNKNVLFNGFIYGCYLTK